MPGLWPIIVFDAASSRFSVTEPRPPLPLRPASHHQKLCLVDGELAFCGGLDIAPERLDDQRHGAESRWHDIQCRVEGAPVFDMERNFFSRWNEELIRFREFDVSANAAQPPFKLELPTLTAMNAQAGARAFDHRPGKSRVQVIRIALADVDKLCCTPDEAKLAPVPGRNMVVDNLHGGGLLARSPLPIRAGPRTWT